MRLQSTIFLLGTIWCSLSSAVVEFQVYRQQAPADSWKWRRDSFNTAIYQASSLYEYLIGVLIGTPGQSMNVTLDTGSSGLWVPSVTSAQCRSRRCDQGSFDQRRSSSYSLVQQNDYNISYAAPGDWDAGDLVSDVVSVGGSPNMKGVRFGLVSSGYDGHGVLGVGYDQLGNPASVIDQMYSQGLIQRRAYSVYLNDIRSPGGSILFGGVDTTKYTGEMIGLPLQTGHSGSVGSFQVTLTSVSFTSPDGSVSQLTSTNYRQNVLLDTGTTGTLLDPATYGAIIDGLGGVYVQEQSVAVPCKYANLNGTINYQFGGSNGPIIRVPLTEIIGAKIYSSREFNDASGGCGTQLGGPIIGLSVLGDSFLRSAYVVFDIDTNMVGMAQAVMNRTSTSSIVTIDSGTSIPGVTKTATVAGTSLNQVQATSSPNVPTVTGASVSAGSPTFPLGVSPTGGASATTSAPSSTSTTKGLANLVAVPTAALVGLGMLAGAAPALW